MCLTSELTALDSFSVSYGCYRWVKKNVHKDLCIKYFLVKWYIFKVSNMFPQSEDSIILKETLISWACFVYVLCSLGSH